ncbi:unnamed protein product [Mycena citricolor]|uniref:Uncharacterized protein n=1 Tax=Mycena citricolor TaxID=2018698 RepID=A0AAD2GZS5_9AGAR|nr:unnamed protein product [Mycena citricolor]CAK5281966.1 unnamed protein product [Mycena citricolor]
MSSTSICSSPSKPSNNFSKGDHPTAQIGMRRQLWQNGRSVTLSSKASAGLRMTSTSIESSAPVSSGRPENGKSSVGKWWTCELSTCSVDWRVLLSPTKALPLIVFTPDIGTASISLPVQC